MEDIRRKLLWNSMATERSRKFQRICHLRRWKRPHHLTKSTMVDRGHNVDPQTDIVRFDVLMGGFGPV